MLSWRLLLATGDSRYADLAERTLFNVVATSPAPDGRAFFYANPLHQRVPGVIPATDFVSNRAASSMREPWFAVSCCPTNVARTFASLAAYLATVDRAGLQLHQYADSRITTTLDDGRRLGIEVKTGYPHDGAISVTVTESDDAPWELALRVPEWAAGAWLTDNGERRPVAPGMASVRRAFTVGEMVELELPVSPRWTIPDRRIDAIRGCAAVEKGPLVLCLESIDLPEGRDLDSIRLDPGRELEERDGRTIAPGRLVDIEDRLWPYAAPGQGSDTGPEVPIPLVPYQQWANRGPATMRVWVPTVDPV